MSSREITTFIENSNQLARQVLEALHTKAEAWATVFYSIDNVTLRETARKNETLPEFVHYLTKVYQNTVFYWNNDLEEEYRLLDISSNSLRWYTDIAAILKVLPPIVSEGKFLIETASALQYIRFYLDQKIWDTLLKEFGYSGKIFRRETNLSEVALHKYLLRSHSRKTPPRSAFDLQLEQLFAKIETVDIPFLKDKTEMKKAAGGNVERMFIGEVFNNCIIANPTFPDSETRLMERCRSFFDLGKLVMKDEDLVDENTFLTFNGKYSK